jgi:hypothetical protein
MFKSGKSFEEKLAVNKPVARVMTKDVIFDIAAI